MLAGLTDARRPRGRPERGRVRLAAAGGRLVRASSSPTATAPRSPRSAASRRLERPRAATASPPSPPPGAARRRPPSATPRTARPAPGLIALGGFAFAPDGARGAALGAASAPPTLIVPELALARRGRDVRLTRQPRSPRPTTCPTSWSRRVERRLAELRERAAAAARPGAGRPLPDRLDRAARALRGRRRARGRADPRRRLREDRARPRGRRARARRRTTRPPSSASCARASTPATSTASAAATPPSSAPRPSCSCAARACAPRPSRSPAPRAAPPTRRSTPTSASSCCARTRTARSRRSSRAGSRARCGRSASGSRRPTSPAIVRVANIQHLATPIRAQLTQPRSAIELAGLLHPTPAVGGEPHAVAAPLIPAFEGLDRGWYAGPVGWTDANEDGEFCVALRCALLQRRARRGSTPASASCATPTPPPSWPRPRSSSARCCRCCAG